MTLVVDLLRHGEPQGGHRIRGWQDDPLSAEGWQQMQRTLPPTPPWQGVITSPLLRCAQFAETWARRWELPLVREPDLRELRFGDWEGRTAEAILAEDPAPLERFWANPAVHPPPGGETLSQFRERVLGAWERLASHYQNARLLVVTHAGVIRLLVHAVLGTPLDRLFALHCPYAGLTRLERGSGGSRLLAHNGVLL